MLVLAALFVVGVLDNITITAGVGNTTAVVGIAKTPTSSPTDAEIETAVRDAIALAGGLPAAIGPGKKIVIQPNLVQAGWPSGSGVVPNVKVIRTVVQMCIEMGAAASDITICEGSASFRDGTNTNGFTDRQMTLKAFKDIGLDSNGDMIEDVTGARLVDANNVGQVYQEYPLYHGPYDSSYVTKIIKANPLINRVYVIPNCVAQCDVLIRIPCLKNHDLAGFTGAVKLAFGLAPSDVYHLGGYNYYKWNLLHQQSWGYNECDTNARGMADMTRARPPDFVVNDGLVGITNGPVGVGGYANIAVPKMACIIAGRDPVAVDAIGTLAIGYKVTSIPGLARANQLGLGTNNPGLIEVRGVAVKDIRRWFSLWGNNCPGVGLPGDPQPPTFTGLTIPDGAHACGFLSVAPVNSSSPVNGLCKGELRIDGVLADSYNVAPYPTNWLVTTESDGAHTLTYTLYDTMFCESSMTKTVYVHRGDPIANALSLSAAAAVGIGPVVFIGRTPAIDGYTYFVASPDGVRGLRVRHASTAPDLPLGRRVCVYGTLSSFGGQRTLVSTAISTYEQGTAVKPRFMTNASLGGAALNGQTPGVYKGVGAYNLGCLVTTSGRVYAGGSDYFWIIDGSIRNRKDGSTMLKVRCGTIGQPSPGSYVSVTGLSCCEDDAGTIRRMLVIRSASDVIVR